MMILADWLMLIQELHRKGYISMSCLRRAALYVYIGTFCTDLLELAQVSALSCHPEMECIDLHLAMSLTSTQVLHTSHDSALIGSSNLWCWPHSSDEITYTVTYNTR